MATFRNLNNINILVNGVDLPQNVDVAIPIHDAIDVLLVQGAQHRPYLPINDANVVANNGGIYFIGVGPGNNQLNFNRQQDDKDFVYSWQNV